MVGTRDGSSIHAQQLTVMRYAHPVLCYSGTSCFCVKMTHAHGLVLVAWKKYVNKKTFAFCTGEF